MGIIKNTSWHRFLIEGNGGYELIAEIFIKNEHLLTQEIVELLLKLAVFGIGELNITTSRKNSANDYLLKSNKILSEFILNYELVNSFNFELQIELLDGLRRVCLGEHNPFRALNIARLRGVRAGQMLLQFLIFMDTNPGLEKALMKLLKEILFTTSDHVLNILYIYIYIIFRVWMWNY